MFLRSQRDSSVRPRISITVDRLRTKSRRLRPTSHNVNAHRALGVGEGEGQIRRCWIIVGGRALGAQRRLGGE